ncbi:MAG: LysR family transcriptional regulator [Eubacterium ramulus]
MKREHEQQTIGVFSCGSARIEFYKGGRVDVRVTDGSYSTHVKALEEQLGVSLFERTKKKKEGCADSGGKRIFAGGNAAAETDADCD